MSDHLPGRTDRTHAVRALCAGSVKTPRETVPGSTFRCQAPKRAWFARALEPGRDLLSFWCLAPNTTRVGRGVVFGAWHRCADGLRRQELVRPAVGRAAVHLAVVQAGVVVRPELVDVRRQAIAAPVRR